MDDFSHNRTPTILFRSPDGCECVLGGHRGVVAVNSRNAGGRLWFSFLFRTRNFCPLIARAVHRVGNPRSIPHALSAAPSLAARRFTCLGNSDRIPSLAVPFDSLGEMARRQGRRPALPGRVPAALPRQTRVPGHFSYRSDRGRSNRLRDKPGVLRKANMDHDSGQGIASVNGHGCCSRNETRSQTPSGIDVRWRRM